MGSEVGKPRPMHALAGLLLALSLPAAAQSVFRWMDEQGQTHYGHAVPPEYRALGYERLGMDGRVLERVEPELTPEARARQALQQAEQSELEAELAKRAARDRLLLTSYRDEQHLMAQRASRLEALEQQRDALAVSYRHAEQRMEDLVARAAQFRQQGETVPDRLENALVETRADLHRLQISSAELDQRMADIRAQFDQDLQRYRSLTQAP